jgi:uncharacterized membrane protein
MNDSEGISTTPSGYLDRVEQLLVDLDTDERRSLLAELEEQLRGAPENDLVSRLGTPEEFVSEYRRSAGLEPSRHVSNALGPSRVATLVSALALPVGVLILFSFGGQLVLGPFVVAIEWILARISPRPLRILWSMLAGALVGEIAVIVMNVYLFPIDRPLIFFVWALIAAPSAVLVYRTSSVSGRIQPKG